MMLRWNVLGELGSSDPGQVHVGPDQSAAGNGTDRAAADIRLLMLLNPGLRFIWDGDHKPLLPLVEGL
jgi:hypothetical protein